jgi:cbb3-type cytochrome oxidase subunit 3
LLNNERNNNSKTKEASGKTSSKPPSQNNVDNSFPIINKLLNQENLQSHSKISESHNYKPPKVLPGYTTSKVEDRKFLSDRIKNNNSEKEEANPSSTSPSQNNVDNSSSIINNYLIKLFVTILFSVIFLLIIIWLYQKLKKHYDNYTNKIYLNDQ